MFNVDRLIDALAHVANKSLVAVIVKEQDGSRHRIISVKDKKKYFEIVIEKEVEKT